MRFAIFLHCLLARYWAYCTVYIVLPWFPAKHITGSFEICIYTKDHFSIAEINFKKYTISGGLFFYKRKESTTCSVWCSLIDLSRPRRRVVTVRDEIIRSVYKRKFFANLTSSLGPTPTSSEMPSGGTGIRTLIGTLSKSAPWISSVVYNHNCEPWIFMDPTGGICVENMETKGYYTCTLTIFTVNVIVSSVEHLSPAQCKKWAWSGTVAHIH